MNSCDSIQYSLLVILAQHDEDVLRKVECLFKLDRGWLRSARQVLCKAQLVVLFDHLFHDGPRSAHKLLQVEGIILPLLFAHHVAVIIFVVALVGDHHIVGSLVPFVHCAKILRLRLLLHILRSCLYKGKFVSARQQLLVIHVVLRTWDHLEDVKELFLTKLQQLFELICTALLRVRGFVIYGGPRHEDGLLRKRLQILLIFE